ncbi:MAG: hypothetical protein LH615_06450, partial [Ferruginibacter sp.]|nr:hypothetical protein [Ferruginibacter sp.]
QEAGKVGGIGSWGRELCCATWLTDFKSVNTNAARYQNLSINQTKLSGQCGRLKCCLNYELDTYMDALQFFPTDADVLETAKGRAFLVKKDIFKNLMWYSVPGSAAHIPMALDTVKKIRAQNKDGIKPEELEAAEIVTAKPKEVEPEYADIVGQISLKSLEKTTRKRRDKERSQQQNQPQRGRQPQAGNIAEVQRTPAAPQRTNNPRGGQQQNQRPPQQQQENRQPQQNREARPPQNRNQNNNNRPPRPQGNRPQQNRGPRNPNAGPKPEGDGGGNN